MSAPARAFPVCRSPIVDPERQFTLIDSNNKKVRFVAHAARTLGLSNVTAVHARAEGFDTHGKPFDTVVARAFAAAAGTAEARLATLRICRRGCWR